MAIGTTTIDFGAAPGTYLVETVVSGQTTIASGAFVEAFLMYESSADHTAFEHQIASRYVKFVCGTIVAATSFTIYATSEIALTGQWTVRWVWSAA